MCNDTTCRCQHKTVDSSSILVFNIFSICRQKISANHCMLSSHRENIDYSAKLECASNVNRCTVTSKTHIFDSTRTIRMHLWRFCKWRFMFSKWPMMRDINVDPTRNSSRTASRDKTIRSLIALFHSDILNRRNSDDSADSSSAMRLIREIELKCLYRADTRIDDIALNRRTVSF